MVSSNTVPYTRRRKCDTSDWAAASTLQWRDDRPPDAMTTPVPEEQRDEEVAARLNRFRDALKAAGDTPTRQQVEEAVALAGVFGLPEQEIANEVAWIRASMAAAALREEIAIGRLPVVQLESSFVDEICHFVASVRTGRCVTDQSGRLLLTSNWLKISGTHALSIAWTQIDEVRCSGSDLLVSVGDRSRGCRLSFSTMEDAARCGVIAAHLSERAQYRSLSAERARSLAMYPPWPEDTL
jgi:hypothetical protein